jgi:putative glycosyltransferase (TIGR04372 family)
MIQKKGYWVIRLGDSAMEELPKRPLLLDLTRTPHNDWLHPYILHQARMLLGTNSGPSWMAQIFGTPVLMTNTTSLARSTLSGSKNSLYIPKWVYINDQRMTLRSLLQHTEGYSELDNEALSERNITLVENSPEEILSATLEMFELIETGRTVEPHYGELIDSIRNQASSISFGKFANSVLRMNEWFLD